jgi:hypothetical protein
MSVSAIIIMLSVQLFVTAMTVYLFVRILKSKEKS